MTRNIVFDIPGRLLGAPKPPDCRFRGQSNTPAAWLFCSLRSRFLHVRAGSMARVPRLSGIWHRPFVGDTQGKRVKQDNLFAGLLRVTDGCRRTAAPFADVFTHG